jgi:serine/threonine protein kinase
VAAEAPRRKTGITSGVYRLTGRLEQGALADLFRAERAGAAVVVKLFHPKTTDVAYARAVVEAAQRLRGVSRAGVAQVLEVGLVRGRLAIVREDVGRHALGLVLQRLNTREVHLPPVLALTLMLELIDLVDAAHEAGVVHGALTPGNVLLGDDGQVGVADFSTLVALEASPALRKAFAARGRSSYRAPEGGAAPTVATDVYALGAIAYELLTLREAALGKSGVSTRADRLPPPSRLVRRLNARVDPVIMRALEAAPARRFRSCRDFADALRDFLSSQGGVGRREDLARFVAELFPNEVQLNLLGPVPFEEPFELADIAGLPSLDVAPDEAVERRSFSGGAVDDRSPTSDDLPAIQPDDRMPTDDDLPMVSSRPPRPSAPRAPITQPLEPSWTAPPAASPAAPSREVTAGPAVDRRVRAVEDFAAGPRPSAPRAASPAARPVPKTLMTFAVPFKRVGDPEVPDLEAMRQRSRRQARAVAFIATTVLMAAVAGLAASWYRSTPDPRAVLLSYLPDPIERELAPNNRPPPIGRPIELTDFDETRRAPPEAPKGVVDAPPPKKVAPKPAPPAMQAGCYRPPEGSTGLLTVAARSVWVELDGQRVCGEPSRIPVAPGTHEVRVGFSSTRREQVSTIRFEPGKLVKLVPTSP